MQKSKRKRITQNRIKIGLLILILATFSLGVLKIFKPDLFKSAETQEYQENNSDLIEYHRPEIDVRLLSVNPYSRPEIASHKINNIVIHYTANPGSDAVSNRDYFEGLKDTHTTKASSHFIVGLTGEIVQCVPTWEIAYASNNRNMDTVSMETCHPDETGSYTKETYASMVELSAWLCLKFDLKETDIIRHYDVTQKICPKYFVDDEDAWAQFKEDVKIKLETMQK